jgi:hypothetical protein
MRVDSQSWAEGERRGGRKKRLFPVGCIEHVFIEGYSGPARKKLTVVANGIDGDVI